MVTKLCKSFKLLAKCSVLAKILMVTKPESINTFYLECSVLAKILMVTKPNPQDTVDCLCSVLAKILMVTKRPCRPGQIA